MASKKPQNERVVERNITSRCDGFSFRVRLTINSARIDETFDTLQEARAYRDRMRADATTDPTHRLVLEAKQKKEKFLNTTLTELLDRYLVEITPKKKGWDVETYKIGKLKRYEIARLPVYLVGRDAVQRFMGVARREGWSENNLRKYLMLISSVFQVATKRWGMVLENPIRSIEVPGNGPARERRLEAGEHERIWAELRKARNPYVISICDISVETASRRGELLKLLRKDVDFANAAAILRNTKNGDDRVIPLSKRAIEVLKQLPISIDGKVFPVTERQIRQTFTLAKQRARKLYEQECIESGVQAQPGYLLNLRFHDLRHEATSRLFEKGLSVMEVASMTGHKTFGMLKRYTHLRPSDLAKKLG